MATIAGTITGVNLLYSVGNRQTYEVCADFGAYTGASDSASITGVGAAIKAKNRNGKTHTVRFAMPTGAGYDTNKQAVYGGACTVSTDDLTFNLSDNTGSELTSATACKGVRFAVAVDET